jgi:hypothetical protein
MKATTTDLLESANKMHQSRMVRAVNEFNRYRLLNTSGDLLNRETGEIYTKVGTSGCSCPDFTGRVQKMRDALTDAGVATGCTCKHNGIRKLLSGQSVKVGNSVFTAKKK